MFIEQSINNIVIVTLVIAGITMVWQFVVWNRDSDPYSGDTSYLDDDVNRAEESVDETEEFMRRMERLSKRSKDDDDKRS